MSYRSLVVSRAHIGSQLRELREARTWTQGELAAQLAISQPTLSQIERGKSSLTAEQLIEVLRLFNVTLSSFTERRVPANASFQDASLQNALARFGARQLRVDSLLVPDDRSLHRTIYDAVLAADPRALTAIAPVLLASVGQLDHPRLANDLDQVQHRARWYWVLENVLAALRSVGPDGTDAAGVPRLRRAIRELEFALALADGYEKLIKHDDVIEHGLRSLRGLDTIKRSESAISRRWRVISSLQPHDFADALKESRER